MDNPKQCVCGDIVGHPVKFTDFGLPDCNLSFLRPEEFAEYVTIDPQDSIGGYHVSKDTGEMDLIIQEKNIPLIQMDDTVELKLSEAPEHVHQKDPTHNTNCTTCKMLCAIELIRSDALAGAKKKPSPRQKSTSHDLAKTIPSGTTPAVGHDVASLAASFFDQLKAKVHIKDLTEQDILNCYYHQNIRLDEVGFKQLVHLVVDMFRRALTGDTGTVVSHPLYSIKKSGRHNETIKKCIYELDKAFDGIDYEGMMLLSRYQSTEYTDIADLENCRLHFPVNPWEAIHPLFLVLAGVKLAGIEQCVVFGDSYVLLKEMFNGGVLSESNIPLLNSRTDDTPEDYLYPHMNKDDCSGEMCRAIIHMGVRKAFLKTRVGDFRQKGNSDLIKNILAMSPAVSYRYYSHVETFVNKVLRLIGHKSFCAKPGHISTHSRNMPYITLSLLGDKDPINSCVRINSQILQNPVFDHFKKRIEVRKHCHVVSDVNCCNTDSCPPRYGHMSHMPHMTPIYHEGPQFMQNVPRFGWHESNQSIDISPAPTFVVYVERENPNRSPLHMGYDSCFPYANVRVDFDKHIVIRSTSYELKAVLCHKSSFSYSDTFFTERHTPCFTIISSRLGYWLYDPTFKISHTSREMTIQRAIRNMWTDDPEGKRAGISLEDWKETKAAEIKIKRNMIQEGNVCYRDFLMADDEAEEMIREYGSCFFYSQEYDIYLSESRCHKSQCSVY